MELSLEELRKKKLTNLLQNPFQQTKFTKTSSTEKIINLFSQFSKEELIKKKRKSKYRGENTKNKKLRQLNFL